MDDGRIRDRSTGRVLAWALDAGVTFLNHGSFGAAPLAVLDAQQAWRERMERNPVEFLARDLEGHLDWARAELARFVGADPADLAFVPNATTGVNTVLRSIAWRPGDEILTTSHVYNACLNAARAASGATGAVVRIADIPFPADPDDVLERIVSALTARTRLALLDHVASPTGAVLPIERLVAALRDRGVEVLVDGAHGPGMLPIDLDRLGAAYYTGNCHKWLCAPKGSAFLHVRRDRQAGVRPVVVSHGASSPRTDRSRFRLEFDWTGTADPSAYLAVPAAIAVIGEADAAGWTGVMAANHDLALAGARRVGAAVGGTRRLPDAMIGAMASLLLPVEERGADAAIARAAAIEGALRARRIEVPLFVWPSPWVTPDAPSYRLAVRLSAQLYNSLDDYGRLADALPALLR